MMFSFIFFYERDLPFMSKATNLKDGKDVSAFFQDVPVHLFVVRLYDTLRF